MTHRTLPPQLNKEGALAFSVPSVVETYHHRPSYPSEVAPFLATLCAPERPHVLELGCGTGELARTLAPLVEHVTAVDISEPMLERAREMRGGDSRRIAWHLGPAEDFPAGRYGLAIAGDSLHWMDWAVLLPRLAREVSPPRLAILTVAHVNEPWSEELLPVIRRYSTATAWQPYSLVELLGSRGLFRPTGSQEFHSQMRQPVRQYVESFHARASFVLERMGEAASEFDAAVSELVATYAVDGVLNLSVQASVTWGEPLDPAN